ncbi:hypothetical protein HanIR_Chr07g0300191 [Helianthus annuus]|nr:hypothetical protein HanIR_Chr07g0300191 [Helianthus annuus]
MSSSRHRHYNHPSSRQHTQNLSLSLFAKKHQPTNLTSSTSSVVKIGKGRRRFTNNKSMMELNIIQPPLQVCNCRKSVRLQSVRHPLLPLFSADKNIITPPKTTVYYPPVTS